MVAAEEKTGSGVMVRRKRGTAKGGKERVTLGEVLPGKRREGSSLPTSAPPATPHFVAPFRLAPCRSPPITGRTCAHLSSVSVSTCVERISASMAPTVPCIADNCSKGEWGGQQRALLWHAPRWVDGPDCPVPCIGQVLQQGEACTTHVFKFLPHPTPTLPAPCASPPTPSSALCPEHLLHDEPFRYPPLQSYLHPTIPARFSPHLFTAPACAPAA
jgi:hypothetical protein